VSKKHIFIRSIGLLIQISTIFILFYDLFRFYKNNFLSNLILEYSINCNLVLIKYIVELVCIINHYKISGNCKVEIYDLWGLKNIKIIKKNFFKVFRSIFQLFNLVVLFYFIHCYIKNEYENYYLSISFLSIFTITCLSIAIAIILFFIIAYCITGRSYANFYSINQNNDLNNQNNELSNNQINNQINNELTNNLISLIHSRNNLHILRERLSLNETNNINEIQNIIDEIDNFLPEINNANINSERFSIAFNNLQLRRINLINMINESLSKLNEENIIKIIEQFENQQTQEICCICHDSYDILKSPPLKEEKKPGYCYSENHLYCEKCLKIHLTNNNNCAICRQVFDINL